ncbi:MAG: hypothetical protein CVV06_01430 [Gammaproteobacteria bacterium HGW-Gammaproteobacteria-10]|nr:MAG: hypothetical protein CVV06_01430 [Gammaproteobacteria bacterium HGW-Gammaproteobacteria-10]
MNIEQIQAEIRRKYAELERLDGEIDRIRPYKRVDTFPLTDAIAELLASGKTDSKTTQRIEKLEAELELAQRHNATLAEANKGKNDIADAIDRKIKALEIELRADRQKLKELTTEILLNTLEKHRAGYRKALDKFLTEVACAAEISERLRVLHWDKHNPHINSFQSEVGNDYESGYIRVRMMPGLVQPSNGSYLHTLVRSAGELPRQDAIEKIFKEHGIDDDLLPGRH